MLNLGLLLALSSDTNLRRDSCGLFRQIASFTTCLKAGSAAWCLPQMRSDSAILPDRDTSATRLITLADLGPPQARSVCPETRSVPPQGPEGTLLLHELVPVRLIFM